MITIISTTSASAKAVTKLDKNKYQLLLLFSDYIEVRTYKEYETLLIGKNTLSYKGTGADIKRGRLAYIESLDEILSKVKGDKVILVGCTGGGMAGGIKVLADALKNANKELSIIVTTPFIFEGPKRNGNSKAVINDLKTLNIDFTEINYDMNGLDKNLNLLGLYEHYDNVICNRIEEILMF